MGTNYLQRKKEEVCKIKNPITKVINIRHLSKKCSCNLLEHKCTRF